MRNNADELLEDCELGKLELTEWEYEFLESVLEIPWEDLSSSQREKLLEISENV